MALSLAMIALDDRPVRQKRTSARDQAAQPALALTFGCDVRLAALLGQQGVGLRVPGAAGIVVAQNRAVAGRFFLQPKLQVDLDEAVERFRRVRGALVGLVVDDGLVAVERR